MQLLQILDGAVQQHGRRLFLRLPVEVVEEVHGIPALLGVLVEPQVAPDGDPLVVEFPFPLAAQLLQGFSTGAEQGHQVGAARQIALLFGDRYPSNHISIFCPWASFFSAIFRRSLASTSLTTGGSKLNWRRKIWPTWRSKRVVMGNREAV